MTPYRGTTKGTFKEGPIWDQDIKPASKLHHIWPWLLSRNFNNPDTLDIFLAEPSKPYLADATVKLADFGEALRLEAVNTLPGIIQERREAEDPMGTAGYRPPESWTGEPGNYLKADIWSVGMVIWELMHATKNQVKIMEDTLQPIEERFKPLKGKIVNSNTFKDLDEDTFNPRAWPDFLPGIMYSKKLHDLVRRCLKTDPEKRPDVFELRYEVDR